MTKIIKILIFLILPHTVCAQQPEKVYSIVKQIKPTEWYIQQAKLWQKVIEKDNHDAGAWLNYYAANRMIFIEAGRNSANAAGMTDSLNGIVNKMAVAIPATFEYNYTMAWNGNITEHNKYASYLEKAYAIDSNRPETYDDFVTLGELNHDEKTKQAFLKKWFASNDISPGILNWNYNILMTTAPHAVLFTGGDNDTYPAWMLQEVKGIRQDIKVINLYLFMVDDYRKALCKELNIPFVNFELNNKTPDDQAKEIGEYIIKNITDRPVYFAETVDPAYYKKFEDSMYLEGLALKFSKNKYDNISVIKKNVEGKFLMDYLNIGFTNDISESVVRNSSTNYIAPLLSLYDYYNAKNEKKKASYYKELTLKIAEKTGDKERVEGHFKI